MDPMGLVSEGPAWVAPGQRINDPERRVLAELEAEGAVAEKLAAAAGAEATRRAQREATDNSHRAAVRDILRPRMPLDDSPQRGPLSVPVHIPSGWRAPGVRVRGGPGARPGDAQWTPPKYRLSIPLGDPEPDPDAMSAQATPRFAHGRPTVGPGPRPGGPDLATVASLLRFLLG